MSAFILAGGVFPSLAEVPEIGGGTLIAEPERIRLTGRTLKGADTPEDTRAPDATVDLGAIFNHQWRNAGVLETGGDRMFISVTFDSKGDAYLSVQAEQWESPNFYKFERALSGEWELPGGKYGVDLDVSIFRSRTSNYVVIKKDGVEKPVYRERIKRLLLQAYLSGPEAAVGAKTYRVFFSYDLDASKKPARIDKDRFGLVFVHDEPADDEHDFHTFIIPYGDLVPEKTALYELYDGQKVGLRLRADNTSLQLYDLTDEEDPRRPKEQLRSAPDS